MLELIDIWKSYEGQPLLRGISLKVGTDETLCLLGPSGSGKSTLLRIIAGLEPPERGQVLWNGKEITRLPPNRRDFGLMFQDYALFPHLDVAGNVAFGLRMRRQPRERIPQAVRAALDRVNLRGFEHRRVQELSGGEQQRVALARTLAPQPRLIMLDEPLGALDRALREELTGDLRRLLHSLHIPSVYVTHDQEEAFEVASQVALLHEGQIVQLDSPAEIVAHPSSAWVARFLGLGNLLPGQVERKTPFCVRTPLGIFEAEHLSPAPPMHEEGWLLLRPGGGRIHHHRIGSQGFLRGLVLEVVLRGDSYRIIIQCSNGVEIFFHSMERFPVGEELNWEPAKGLYLR